MASTTISPVAEVQVTVAGVLLPVALAELEATVV